MGNQLLSGLQSALDEGALDGHIQRALDASYHDCAGGWDATGVRHWIRYHVASGLDPFDFADHSAPLAAKLADEWRLMRFIAWLVEAKEPGVAVDTASGYASTVQGWLARNFGVKLGGGLDFHRLPNMLKGMHRLKGGKPRRRVRKALTPQKLALAFVLGTDPNDAYDANLRAALACMLQGLLRGGEAGLSKKHKWTPEGKTTRSDLHVGPAGLEFLIAPLKNSESLGAKNLPVLIGRGGTFVDAVWEVENMLSVSPAAANAPAFINTRKGRCFTVDELNLEVQRLMKLIGEEPSEYGSHSARIGGATALFKSGRGELDIRTMGRWDSEIYRIYVHADRERAFENARIIASQQVAPLEDAYDEVDFY